MEPETRRFAEALVRWLNIRIKTCQPVASIEEYGWCNAMLEVRTVIQKQLDMVGGESTPTTP